MKNILNTVLLMAMLVISIAICDEVFFSNVVSAQQTLAATNANASITKATVSNDLKIAYEKQDDLVASTNNFFKENWGKLVLGLLAFADVIVRLTPTVKDNSILSFISNFLNYIIPNRRADGGTF